VDILLDARVLVAEWLELLDAVASGIGQRDEEMLSSNRASEMRSARRITKGGITSGGVGSDTAG
jgi:hypothetical protein